MKITKSKSGRTPQLDRRKSLVLNTLLVVCALWFLVVLFGSPGWATLGLFVNPSLSLTSLIPVIAVRLANALRPKGETLPKQLYWIEVVFCVLWILLWSFFVNGGDTEESIHSIFSLVFGGAFGGKALVALSGPLFGCTAIILAALAFLMAIYKQPAESAKRAVWGRRLLIANFTFFLISSSVDPIFASFGIYINPSWTWYYEGLGIAGGLLSVLNIGYLIRYFVTKRNISKKFWVFGILAILASAYYIWSYINLFVMYGVSTY